MAASIVFSIVFCMLRFITLCTCERGFILTSPKVLDAGSTEYFPLTLFDVPQGGSVWLRLLKIDSEEVISESNAYPTKNNMWMEMEIPSIPDKEARLNIIGEFNGEYHINTVKEVRIRHKSVITFIQTDKPIYKPSQTVRFRIFPMNVNLKPVDGNTVGEIWIEDPSGIRVAQWKSVKFTDGIVQLELPLSNEPVFGEWNIKVIIQNTTHSNTFTVKEYVLPKFEVIITPPNFIMNDAVNIPTKICARYTYGKQVDGMLKVSMTHERYQWDSDKTTVLPTVAYEGKISGCYDFHVKTADLLMNHSEFSRRKLKIFAEVTENGTEVTRNATRVLEKSHSPLKIEFLGTERGSLYYKAGLPFYGKFKVTKPDSTPASSEEIEVCVTITRTVFDDSAKHCRTYISDKHGHVNFSIPPQDPSSRSISLKVTAVKYSSQYYENGYARITQPGLYISLKPWFSRSNSYLQIEPIYKEVQCEKLEEVKVRYTAKKDFTATFYHQVISRGLIVQQGSHHRSYHDVEDAKDGDDYSVYVKKGSQGQRLPYAEKADNSFEKLFEKHSVTLPSHVGEFILSFDARATMSPIARLLVFYVRSDGEVVADSLKFRIAPCFSNKARLNFRHEQQYPSTETAILLSASPFSLCGIGLVDKSVHLLNPESQLNREKIFKLLESYDVDRDSLPKQVSSLHCQSARLDIGDIFKLHHLHPSFSTSVYVDSMTAFEEAGMVVISDYILETRKCQLEGRSGRYPISLRHKMLYGADDDYYWEGVDFYHEDTFMYTGEPALRSLPKGREASKRIEDSPTKSSVEIRNYFPETWLWELINVGETGETTFKRELPHTITKWMGSAICIHPQSGLGISDVSSITAFQPFFVSYNLPYSVIRDEVVPLTVSVFNYLTECLPIKLSLEPSEFFKVVDASRNHKFCVCGGKSESHKFLIRPVTLGKINITVYGYSMEEDLVCGNEITARLSAKDAVTKPLLIEAEGFPKEEVVNIYFCPQQSNGSYIAEINLLPPENVVEGSSRAYVSVSGDLMAPALNGLDQLVKLPMGCGEQNMVLFTPNIFVLDYLTSTNKITPEIKSKTLSHMKTGYQRELRYRHSDGSYSAFGKDDDHGSIWLTSFVVRSFAQARRFISVDEKDLALSTAWIFKKQFENGCFENFGSVLHKAMKGGLKDDEQSLAPLTAYVLIALLEANVTQPQVVESALHCIQTDKRPSSYSLALFAYAAALAKRKEAQDYLNQLESLAIRKDNMLYWDYEKTQQRSVSVEIAGYAILTLLEIGGRENTVRVLPIVRWITKQRNSNGGFVSTQDTVIALQALAKYASHNKDSDVLSLSIDVESADLIHNFEVNEDNKLLTQSVKIPTLPTGVDLHAVGSGCALAQFTFKYNVLSIPGSDAFDLKINSFGSFEGLTCSPTIGICMRYKLLGQKSNMVVVSVKMASGYVPDEHSLHKLGKNKDLQLKRHDVNGNEVNFYFYELSNKRKCFQFLIKKEIAVENSKPSTVKLYDYYQPELEVTTDYEIPRTCSFLVIPYFPELLPLQPGVDDEPFPDASTLSPFSDPSAFPFRSLITSKVSDTFSVTDDPMINFNITYATDTENEYVDPTESTILEFSSSAKDDDTVTSVMSINEFNDGVDDAKTDTVDLQREIATSRFLDHFVTVNYDLDTPDGVEGNQAVSLLPAEDFHINTTVEGLDLNTVLSLTERTKDESSSVTVSATSEESPDQHYFDNTNVSVELGKTVYLHCRVPEIDDKYVTWISRKYFVMLAVGQTTYTADPRFSAMKGESSGDWMLKITDVQRRDEGLYECQINSYSSFFTLTVLVPRAHILEGPNFYIKSGSTINLTCIITESTSPSVFVFWYHDDQMINYNSSRGGIRVIPEKGPTTVSRLEIQRAQSTDSGNYSCQHSNADPANINVYVHNEETDILDCPICLPNFPTNFSNIYCTSVFALRINIRDINSGSLKVKVMHDISSFLDQPQKIKEFGLLSYDERCDCMPLNQRQLILLVGMEVDSWNKEEGKHKFIVNSRTYIIPLIGKYVQPPEVKTAKDICKEDP